MALIKSLSPWTDTRPPKQTVGEGSGMDGVRGKEEEKSHEEEAKDKVGDVFAVIPHQSMKKLLI